MGRTVKPLTNTQIKQAKSQASEYTLADGRKLLLRIKPNGTKRWILNYTRPFTSKRSNLTLGRYPEVSLAAARKKREHALELLASNLDPHEEQLKERFNKESEMANTLNVIAKEWFNKKKKPELIPSYADDLWNSLSNHVLPTLGKVPIHKLRAIQVVEVLQQLYNQGKRETVKRICQRLNQIMTYAMVTGRLDTNPLTGVGTAFLAPTRRHLPTIQPDQLRELVGKINNASIMATTRCLINWQLHTMTRPGEAAGTKWEEISLESKIWTIPPERMKKSRTHIVPLTNHTIAILEEMKPISGKREHVFPGQRTPRKPTNDATANMALRRMGYKGKLVAHGLRALASTTLNEKGFEPDIIESALAHIDSNTTRAAYNRAEYLERRKVMMDWWSSRIVNPKPDEPESNIVRMRHSTKTLAYRGNGH